MEMYFPVFFDRLIACGTVDCYGENIIIWCSYLLGEMLFGKGRAAINAKLLDSDLERLDEDEASDELLHRSQSTNGRTVWK